MGFYPIYPGSIPGGGASQIVEVNMNREEFDLIFDDDESGGIKLCEDGCNALKGLNIITKYFPNAGVQAAEHDIIYSVSADGLVEAGITEVDARELHALNWMIDEDRLACFV